MPDQGFTFGAPAGATYGQSTGGTLGADTPRAVQSLTVTQGSSAGETDLSWAANDTADEYTIYRATASGSSTSDYSQVATVAAPTTSHTDTGLDDGTEYHYRVTASNHRGESGLSPEASAVTILPAPTDVAIANVAAETADVSWTDNTDDEAGYRVLISRDGGASWSNASGDLAADTTSYTLSGLLNGEEYTATVEVFTADAATRDASQPVFTTTLPDEDQPVLGNGVEDEVAVDRETAVSNYGDVRIQIRETGQSSWDSNATGFSEFLGNFDTLTMEFVGREDGEQYEVRARTETEHVTGTWTDAVSIITKFPGATNFSIDAVDETSADVSWTDNADNEDGFRLQHRKQYADGWGPWRTGEVVGPNTEAGTNDALQPGRTYQLRVQAFTEYTTAESGTVETTTTSVDVRQRDVPSTGWYVEVDHPNRTAPLTPSILDDPEGGSTVNGLPQVTISVPRDEAWQAEAFEDATMRVWEDGERRPIEELSNVRMRPDRTVLEGRGGVDLDERVQRSVDFEDADVVVEELINNNTPYQANVDDPQNDVTEELIQEADDTSSWQATGDTPTDSPVYIAGDGTVRSRQTCWVFEAEDDGPWTFLGGNTAYSNEEAAGIGGSSAAGDTMSFSFTTDYDIPADQFQIDWRQDAVDYTDGTATTVAFDVKLDGTVLTSYGQNFETGFVDLQWTGASNGNDYGDVIPAGSHTLTFEVTQNGDGTQDTLYIDCIAAYDDRYSYTFDNDNGNPYSFDSADLDAYDPAYLDGPGLVGGGIQYESDDISPALSVVGARLATTWVDGDTSGAQAVGLSVDSGQSWATETNTTSIERDYQDASLTVRWRLTFDGRGERTGATPLKNIESQAVQSLDLYADLDDTPTLANRSFDARVRDVLSTIAREKNALWEVRQLDEQTMSVEWTQLEQRTSDIDPDIIDYQVNKSTAESVQKMTIYGSSRRREGESVTANHGTAVDLDESQLVPNKETVRDADTGEQYQPDTDYSIDPLAGTITTLSSGSITDGQVLEVNYDYKLRGSYTMAGVSDPDEDVETITGLGSNRVCEQAAFYVVDRAGGPIWSGTVTIPRQEVRWEVIEALNAEQLPTQGQYLQTTDITTSTSEIVLDFESQGLSDIIERIESRVSDLARNT